MAATSIQIFAHLLRALVLSGPFLLVVPALLKECLCDKLTLQLKYLRINGRSETREYGLEIRKSGVPLVNRLNPAL